MKFLKKPQFKYKLRLLGGGGKKKKAKLDDMGLDDNESQNLKNLHEIRSNRTDTIMKNYANQKDLGDDMVETVETIRQEKKAEKKYNVDLNDIKEYLDTYATLTYERKQEI